MTGALVVFLGLALLVMVVISRTAVVVPQQSAFVVERLGRYRATLDAGFHILLPFIDAIRYRHSIKEHAGEIPEQICITRDNVQVHVDGVLYLKVMNPERASYGVTDYLFAISQLAQTALRSEIGKIDLDKTFESRTQINTEVVNELDKATEPWGIKVLRYEIKNITPPADVLAAMEKQMRAEREKRAVVLTSEGQRDAAINSAEGEKQQVIKASEAKKQQQINEAEGQAAAILAVAEATAEGIRKVAEAIKLPGGYEAVQLRVAEQYIGQFGQLAKESNTVVMPGAERHPVLAPVPAAARAEDDVMIVQLPPRRAHRHRAAPPVAGEHRIAMARLPRPLGLRVQEQRFEPLDERAVRGCGEGEDGRPEERDDRNGSGERDLGIRKLPLRTRTQLPVLERERCPDRRRGDRRKPVAHGEGPLDLVGEPAHGAGAGALDPGGGRRLSHDGKEGERPDPGQPSTVPSALARGVDLI